jgi:tetratricopeptide (TPR) repeat protein
MKAAEIIRKAWRTRAQTIQSPPESPEDLQEIMERVYGELSEAVSICRDANAGIELVHALRKLGHVAQDLGREAETASLYDEAVLVSRESGDARLLAHSVRHAGDIRRGRGDMAGASLCYEEALGLYRSLDPIPPGDLANTVRPMALVQEVLGNQMRAKALYQEARDVYQALGLQEGVDECSVRLANLQSPIS